MSNANLSTSDITNFYFGTRKGLYVYLGTTLIHVNDMTLYTGNSANSSIADTIEAGDSSNFAVDVLEAPGAIS